MIETQEQTEVALEERPCPLGCPTGDEPVLTGRDRLSGQPGRFTVVRCRGCGLLRTNPRPTPEAMGAFYPDDYGPYRSTTVGNGSAGPPRPRPGWKRMAARAIEFNTHRLPPLPPGRMLEIGCASGAFLHRMAGEGWDVAGIEYSPRAAEAARRLGYPVHAGPLETAPEPEAPFGLVVGWMVLEHLHEPLAALEKLHRWTRPGAWLAASIPNAGAAEFRLFKDAWYALHIPNHLYYYTPRTIGLLLAQSGWRLERVHHHRTLVNLMGSLGFALEDRGRRGPVARALADFPRRAGAVNYATYPLASLLGLFGQTGRMTIWARRVDG